MEHWDGKNWTKVDVEMPYGNTKGELLGVSVISADDAWAVGWTDEPERAALALHWDGETWTSVEIDSAEASTLRGVHALATDDVWAVGSRDGVGLSLIHWDGTDWTRYPSHTGHKDWVTNSLWGVHAIATNDVWAVGGYGNELAEPDRIHMLHWDGTRWSKIHVPNPGEDENRLFSISGTSPNDVWAVGSYSHNGSDSRNLYLHWDGRTWTKVNAGHKAESR